MARVPVGVDRCGDWRIPLVVATTGLAVGAPARSLVHSRDRDRQCSWLPGCRSRTEFRDLGCGRPWSLRSRSSASAPSGSWFVGSGAPSPTQSERRLCSSARPPPSDPDGWSRWVRFLTASAGGSSHTLWVRAAISLGLVVGAALADRRWMLPVALLVATPVFAGTASLTILAALPRLSLPLLRGRPRSAWCSGTPAPADAAADGGQGAGVVVGRR